VAAYLVAGAARARRCPGLRPAHRAAGGPDTPAYAALARVADPARRPPAYTEVAQLDMFRHEDLAYALRLGQAGVPVEFHLHTGAPRESDFIAFNTTAARRAIADRVIRLRGLPWERPIRPSWTPRPAPMTFSHRSWSAHMNSPVRRLHPNVRVARPECSPLRDRNGLG
jgi:alpha/beta hydrolase fold